MKRVKVCPNCMNIIHRKDEECSECGMKVSEMVDNSSLFPHAKKEDDAEVNKLSRKEKRKLEESKEIDFEQEFYGDQPQSEQSNQESNDENQSEEEETPKRKRHKHKRKKKDLPNYSINSEGEFEIDTKDVTFFETQEEYSVKKARGDYKPEKIEWWEIYKWADRLLARRKIKKEVNKAAVVRPEFISKPILLLLCMFFGWMGAHNFYARNHAKGWTVLAMLVVASIVVQVPVLYAIMGVFVGGGLGFVVISMWMYDFICICFNKYKFRITKMQFIRKLNTETRAKLGKRYINMK